jgi:hypothetical protein
MNNDFFIGLQVRTPEGIGTIIDVYDDNLCCVRLDPFTDKVFEDNELYLLDE